ncbi:MAG: methyltransferase domain-containing protein [Myxococcales bacterium]|nr:methyltransferase domain-containing protein [Myxococcales bacterium]MCB9569904.1 methyltransferase domain-containing protein [Myxococcales bacterium]MCB9704058.1 methyltransferase domain-containing protein [Myxococcales bacterium]
MTHGSHPSPTTPASPWWHDLYDDLLAEILLERHDPAEVEATLDFIVRRLGVSAGARLFDQCCGIGSLALPLAERGYRLVAVDQAASYIDRARDDADREGHAIDYVAGDARDYVPPAPCDGAFNWWTSFGYGADDQDNARMLAAAFASLRPGARFLLDTMNAAGVLRRFQPHVVTRREGPEGELVLVRESALDLAAGVIQKRWTYFLPDGRRVSYPSRVRLYMPNELDRLLRGVGFVDVEFFGGIADEPLSLDTLRCICSARRPA